MKVCQVTHTFLPDSIGGREIHVYNLAKALGKQGVPVQIITGVKRSQSAIPPLGENVSLTRLRSITLSLARGSTRVNARFLPSLPLALMTSGADLIHAHDYYHFSSDVAALTSRVIGKPFVLTIHSRLGFFTVNRPIRVMEKVYNRSLGRWTLNRASKIIFVAHSSAKEFIDAGLISKEKVVVIHPAIDVDEFDRDLQSLQCNVDNIYHRKFGLQDSRIVLSLGRIEKRKGLQHVIRVLPDLVREFPGLKFVVAGPDAGCRSELENLAGSLGVGLEVLFTGLLSDAEVKEALFFANVFVLPSEHENFPEVALRAAYLGRPIVASNVGGIPEFIDDGENGLLVKVGDGAELADAIRRVLSDRTLAVRLGRNAQEKVLKHHTMQEMAKKTIEVYEKVLGGGYAHGG